MGSSYLQELTYAAGSGRYDKASLKPQLLRLTRSMRHRTLSRDRSSLEFVKSGVALLEKLKPLSCQSDCYDSLASAVPYLWAHAELHAALRASELMCKLAASLQRKDLTRQAENFTGIIKRSVGDVAGALIHHQRALSLARELGDLSSEAVMLHNIACALMDIGCYSDAELCCERVIRLSGEALRACRSSSYHNLATLFSRTGRHAEALQAARQAFIEIPEATTIQDCYTRAMREAAFIYTAVDLCDDAELDHHLGRCRHYAERSGTRPSFGYLTLADALCAIRHGQADGGIARLQGVLDESGHLRHPGLRDDSLAALIWAHERRGEPAIALSYLRRMISALVEHRGHVACELSHAVHGQVDGDLLPLRYQEAKLEAAATAQEARTSHIEMLQRLAMAATLRDDPSGMHGYRVGRLSGLLAAKTGWTADRCYALEIAARLHDIGKAAVPDHILFNSGPLERTDRNLVEAHPEIGLSLLARGWDADSKLAAEIALHHHEQWDGHGYPRRISENRIPLSARMVAIADVFDALTHGRPYSSPWSLDKVLAELTSQSGRQFDPNLVPLFVELVTELANRYGDIDRCLQAGHEVSPFLEARRHISEILHSRH